MHPDGLRGFSVAGTCLWCIPCLLGESSRGSMSCRMHRELLRPVVVRWVGYVRLVRSSLVRHSGGVEVAIAEGPVPRRGLLSSRGLPCRGTPCRGVASDFLWSMITSSVGDVCVCPTPAQRPWILPDVLSEFRSRGGRSWFQGCVPVGSCCASCCSNALCALCRRFPWLGPAR